MRWLAIKKRNGKLDEFAMCFATHTVAMTGDGGTRRYQAWRLGRKSEDSVLLDVFETSAAACAAVEQDARAAQARAA